jgi:hypothetical protein
MNVDEHQMFQYASFLAMITFCVLVGAAYITGGRAVTGVKAGLITYLAASTLAAFNRVDVPIWAYVVGVPAAAVVGILVALTMPPSSQVEK